jgi:DNA-binding GntR family transcriptional regulator
MSKIKTSPLAARKQKEIKQLLLAGDFASAERILFEHAQVTGAKLLQSLMNEVTASPEGIAIITAMKTEYVK